MRLSIENTHLMINLRKQILILIDIITNHPYYLKFYLILLTFDTSLKGSVLLIEVISLYIQIMVINKFIVLSFMILVNYLFTT
jgi:hypothetical protein